MTDSCLFLMDGNNLTYRSYHATASAGLCDRYGRPTGAVHGTIASLRAYVRDFAPSHMLWCFDSGGSDFRSALRSDYKGHRKLASVDAHRPNPREEVPPQLEAIQEFLPLVGVGQVSEQGVEADDLIATAVHRWRGEMPIVIVSGDHDLLQLLDDKNDVRVLRPGNSQAGRSGGVGLKAASRQLLGQMYTEQTAEEKYGVPVERLVDAWALTGDIGDNIAGIPKVGPKTAAKWITAHGNLEAVLAAEEKAEGYEEQCRENYRMIHLDGTLGVVDRSLADCAMQMCDLGPVVDWLLDRDLYSLAKSIVEDGLWHRPVE